MSKAFEASASDAFVILLDIVKEGSRGDLETASYIERKGDDVPLKISGLPLQNTHAYACAVPAVSKRNYNI